METQGGVEIGPAVPRRVVKEVIAFLVNHRVRGGQLTYQYGLIKVLVPPEWAGKRVRVIAELVEP